MGLKYVGAAVANNDDLAYQSYVSSIKGADLSTAQIDSQINTDLSGYTTSAYVDTRDALNATVAYVDAGDALRVRLADKDVALGVAGLDATGHVDSNRINVPNTQQFNRGPWTPAGYQSLQNLTSEVTLFTIPVTDPGYPYKVVCMGTVDAGTNITGDYPLIGVRQGSVSGPLVAYGSGCVESYGQVQTKQIKVAGAYSYTIPPWATRIDIVLLGGGAGGQGGNPFQGKGGGGGVYTTATVIKGSSITGSTITGTIGGGGAGGDASTSSSASAGDSGGATTAVATGMTSLSAAGGTNSNPFSGGNNTGLSPGNKTFNSQIYVGGLDNITGSANGNAPGGGGAGGQSGATVGGNGASGGAWFFAYGSPNPNNAPAIFIPIGLSAQSALTGPTTLYVRAARSGAASTISVSAFKPSIHIMAIPA